MCNVLARTGVWAVGELDGLSGHIYRNCIKGIDGLIDGDLEIVVLRGEGRIQYEYCIRSYLTNGDFWAMHMDTVILFESYVLFSNLADVV